MITKKLLLAAIAATSIIFPATLPAQGIRIEIGDRPYYRYGPRYWNGDYEMVWVPGHWYGNRHRRWVHGHYVRSEQRRHHWQRHNEDYRDYRESDRYYR